MDGDQTNLKVEFPSAITLAEGEALRVKVDYLYTSPPSSPGLQMYNFLRFGAYDDQGTGEFTDDEGYLADVSYWKDSSGASSSKSGDYAIRKEANVFDDFDMGPLLDNESAANHGPPSAPEAGDIVTLQTYDGMSATWPKWEDDGTTEEHAAVLCLVNVGGTIEARLFHAFPPTYVGSAVDIGSGAQLTFNSIYLESPSDNNGFLVRRIAAQHVSADLDCCDPGQDIPEEISDCEFMVHTARADGPSNGGSPNPLDPSLGWTYTPAQGEQGMFFSHLASLGLGYDIVTFEQANGWSPVNGQGDQFAGTDKTSASDYHVAGASTSAAYNRNGLLSNGTASGNVDYFGPDNLVTFELYNNGHVVDPPDEPGIGDMDGSNNTDRGVNTTPSGYHFLEVLPSERSEGGLSVQFDMPVAAVGFYLMGVEQSKRDVEFYLQLANGSYVDASSEVTKGPYQQGGVQFIGYHVLDLSDKGCYIKSIKLVEPYNGEPSGDRDIFAIDDLVYSTSGNMGGIVLTSRIWR